MYEHLRLKMFHDVPNFNRVELGSTQVITGEVEGVSLLVQGYLAHKKTPTPLGQPYDPRHSPSVGS